eukprot:CAMPEP_0198202848 /NCGR_PEP_ID=MMETSP1445-20131203/6077_1 /TAXON_ID=36898 /ORGANISM="Pyramimonas sp., Strain CCMP2087" /LENGTH=398 /DNA_ID=CAMNT_0043873969 /DNA_START=265 /DNA_END=1461 /DNA_ORIENTATION=+
MCSALRLHLPSLVSNTGLSKPMQSASDMRNEKRQLCEPSGLPLFNYSHVDVVVVMASPVCVTQQTIMLLRFNFNFRKIFYIVKHKEFCPYLESIDENVICVDENTVIPGVSYTSLLAPGISDNLIKHQGINNRVGWYFQQYLKLGVALHLKSLSDHYLIWDADNIPIKPFQMFTDDGKVTFCANPSSVKAVGYSKFYKAVLGEDLPHPTHNGNVYNFVCGYMMFYKPYVKEMLGDIQRHLVSTHQVDPKLGFPWNIHAVADKLIEANVLFSEFDTYGGWMMNHKERSMEMDFDISYVRNPGTSNPKAPSLNGGPAFVSNLRCCLNQKRVCALGKAQSPGPHGLRAPAVGTRHHILIWEEHKFRYRTGDFCVDKLPADLQMAIDEVGTGVKPASRGASG